MFKQNPPENIVATRSKISNWISNSCVLVNQSSVSKAGFKLSEGDSIQVEIPDPKKNPLEPDPSIELDIVFEDDDILIINKQAGLVVHPGAGNFEKTLVHALLAHVGDELKQVGDSLRPGIVHRLDKDTSGLMVVAKNDKAFLNLVEQFKPPRTIHREYLAITSARPKDESGVIELAIGRHPVKRKEMTVLDVGGKSAKTLWNVEKRLDSGCLLRLQLTSGRTHQIRVHLKHSSMPIVGDPLYGLNNGGLSQKLRAPIKKLGRQALHAWKLSFIHPSSEKELSFEQALPDDMQTVLKAFS